MIGEVKGLVVDLDDCLVYTHEMFLKAFQLVSRDLSRDTGLTFEDAYEKVWEINNLVYQEHHTDRSVIWDAFLQKMSDLYELSASTRRGIIQYTSAIYTTVPRVKDGVPELLMGAKDIGLRLGVNTQADTAWTDFKLGKTGLIQYFDSGSINCVETGSKTPESWITAAGRLGLVPGDCAMVGDNKISDITSATLAGYAKRFWLNDSGWEQSHKGELPEDAIEISHLSLLIPTLQKGEKEHQVPKV